MARRRKNVFTNSDEKFDLGSESSDSDGVVGNLRYLAGKATAGKRGRPATKKIVQEPQDDSSDGDSTSPNSLENVNGLSENEDNSFDSDYNFSATMARNSEKTACTVVNNETEFHNFTWKIPNISSIPHTVDYAVQSPSFSFGDSSWILKMYPYGQEKEGSKGYIDVILERLNPAKEENISIRAFCEDVFGREFFCGERNSRSVTELHPQIYFYNIMQNLKDNPEKWRLAPNDTFSFLCAIQKTNRPYFLTESAQQNLGKRYKRRKIDNNPEIGEILEEYSAFKSFSVKICKIEPVPAGYAIHLPFYFAKAKWILKVYPYFRMENSNKQSVDFVLERLYSQISEHFIILKIIMDEQIEQSSFFNEHHTQGNAVLFPFQFDPDIGACIHFRVNIRMKKISGLDSDSRTKSIKQVEGENSVLGSSIVLQNFKKLYLQQEDCDVIFNVKGKEFKAHRLVLKAQSPVLASAFRIDMKEKVTGIFNVEDCEPAIFSNFLHFLYCGEVENLSKENVFGLFAVADKYDVSNLRAMCMELIKQNLSVETFCDTIALAQLHSEAELIKLSTDFFAKNLQKIIVTDKWQSFIVENPIRGNDLMIKALVPGQRNS